MNKLQTRHKHWVILLSLITILYGLTGPLECRSKKSQLPFKHTNSASNNSKPPTSKPIVKRNISIDTKRENARRLLTKFEVERASRLELLDSFTERIYLKSLNFGQNSVLGYLRSKQAKEYGLVHLTPVANAFGGATLARASPKLAQNAINASSYIINFKAGIQAWAFSKNLITLRNDHDDQLRFVPLTCSQVYNLFTLKQDGKLNFFNNKCECPAHSLFKPPLKSAKICVASKFGMRRHPLSGRTRQHKGMDYCAATGTPVLAAGDGQVVASGWSSSYGNHVRIRHIGGYQTIYAHLKYISKNIKLGAPVAQRQVLGGVGMTGTANGPHLHFEIILNNTPINPMKISMLPTLKLTSVPLKKFEVVKSAIQKVVNLAQTEPLSWLQEHTKNLLILLAPCPSNPKRRRRKKEIRHNQAILDL